MVSISHKNWSLPRVNELDCENSSRPPLDYIVQPASVPSSPYSPSDKKLFLYNMSDISVVNVSTVVEELNEVQDAFAENLDLESTNSELDRKSMLSVAHVTKDDETKQTDTASTNEKPASVDYWPVSTKQDTYEPTGFPTLLEESGIELEPVLIIPREVLEKVKMPGLESGGIYENFDYHLRQTFRRVEDEDLDETQNPDWFMGARDHLRPENEPMEATINLLLSPNLWERRGASPPVPIDTTKETLNRRRPKPRPQAASKIQKPSDDSLKPEMGLAGETRGKTKSLTSRFAKTMGRLLKSHNKD